MSSSLRRSGTKLLSFLQRASDPLPLAGETRIYAKAVSALAQLFVREGAGIINQMVGPGAVFPTAYLRGLRTSWVSVSQVQVAVGRARDSTDVFDINLTGATTADITVAGVNGLDAGAEAASTWYHIFIIGDSTGVLAAATLLSASATAPTLPAGYNVFRRVGSVRNSSGSNFLRFTQVWTGRTRRHWFDESLATLQVLTAGSAVAATAVSCATRCPPTGKNVVFQIEFMAAGASNQLQLTSSGTNNVGPFHRPGQVTVSSLRWVWELLTDASQQVFYFVTNAADVANLYVLAYDDEL